MTQAKTWVGLDVHVAGTVAAILDGESGELRRQRLSGRTGDVAAFVSALPGPVRATYEAGPTGFSLARQLAAVGVDCSVCAPGLIPRGPSDRVKTDQRDAERLVRLLLAGELHRVVIPSIEEEALRDLVRARETCAAPWCAPGTDSPSCCCATTSASTARNAIGRRRTCAG